MKSDIISKNLPKTSEIVAPAQARLRKVKIALAEPFFTIIHEDGYSSRDLKTLIDSTSRIPSTEAHVYRSDYVSDSKVRLCYAVPGELVDYINVEFDSPTLVHFITTQIESITTIENVIKASVIGQRCFIVAKNGGALRLANSYRIDTWQTVFYYVQLARRTAGLEDQSFEFILSGTCPEEADIVQMLRRYLPNGSFYSMGLSCDGQGITEEHHLGPLHDISKCA